MKSTAIPRWGQVTVGAVLLSIAVTAGLTGLKINVFHGLEVSPEAGILFGLADLSKLALPIIAGLIGWSRQMRITAAVCVVVSLWCASSAYMSGAGQQIAGKQHGADQYSLAKDAVTKADAEVTRLNTAVDAERKNGGCGKQCKFLLEQADKARQEAKEARTALASTTAVDVTGNERTASAITAGLFLFLIEALVWLSVPAMKVLASATARVAPVVTEKPKKAPKPVTKKKTTRRTQKAVQKLMTDALKKPDRRRKGMKIRNDNFVTAND
jgi:hypothetical protein